VDQDELRQLMTAYQAGSLHAFERLYTVLASPLLAYLIALCRDRAHAQDLLQETFLQIHRSRRAYRTDLPVRPWVFTIARHVWLMDRRTRSRRPAADQELPDLPVPAEVEGLAERDRLTRALAGLLPDRREALLLITSGASALPRSVNCWGSVPMPRSSDPVGAWATYEGS
jgi:RNA polymerase sigma-70 factor (ECF subfamily)